MGLLNRRCDHCNGSLQPGQSVIEFRHGNIFCKMLCAEIWWDTAKALARTISVPKRDEDVREDSTLCSQ